MAPENPGPDPLRNSLSWEEHAPRDESNRFRIYRLCGCPTCEGARLIDEKRCPECRGEGVVRQLLATAPDPESVGVALVELGRDGEFEDCPAGVLDVFGEKGQKWILRPWQASPRNASDAGRVLAKSKASKR